MEINEKTKVLLFPLATAGFFVFTALIGFVFWLASVSSDAAAAKAEASGLRALVLDVRERVIRIEEHQKNN